MCPECGSDAIRLVEFDFGICSQTGYHDYGEYYECRECGAKGDPDDLILENRFVRQTAVSEPVETVAESVRGQRDQRLDMPPPIEIRPHPRNLSGDSEK